MIIIVDSGSKSIKEIDYLNTLNIQTIIIDHHEIVKPYPKASVFINPKKNHDNIFLNNLCASTLTYFLIELIYKDLKINEGLYSKLKDGVALVEPKVMEPFDPVPGRVPRRVAIDRKTK